MIKLDFLPNPNFKKTQTLPNAKDTLFELFGFKNCFLFENSLHGYEKLISFIKSNTSKDTAYHAGTNAFLQMPLFDSALYDGATHNVLFIPKTTEDTYENIDLGKIRAEQKEAFIVSDFSYAFELDDLKFVDIAILRGFGANLLFCNDKHFGEKMADDEICSQVLEVFKNRFSVQDFKCEFISALQNELGSDCYLFSDLSKSVPNGFCMGFRGIRARNLMNSLKIDKISVINGEACFLGLEVPSLTLKNIGYDEKTRREAVSFSFENRFDFESVAKKISKKYRQIRALS